MVISCCLLLGGCAQECELPTGLSPESGEYTAFGNPVEFSTDSATNPPGQTPINGYTTWTFDWQGGVNDAPVTLTINDQPFEATGRADEIECGRAVLSGWSGVFEDEEGVEHSFNASGYFLFWDDRFEASVTWSENWNDGAEQGNFTATEASITGSRSGEL